MSEEEVEIREENLSYILAAMLLHGQVYLLAGETPGSMQLMVNCSDTFIYACADAEPVLLEEIESLCAHYDANPIWGTIKWCCLKRRQRPLRIIVQNMHNANVWDETLDLLPYHKQDKVIKR